MARQVIDTTTNNGSYIGDPAPVAFNKVNGNFVELYTGKADVSLGFGSATLSTMPNLDAASLSRFWSFRNLTTTGVFPTNQTYGTLIQLGYQDGAQFTQLATSVTNNEMAFRYYNGSWQPWNRLWHTGNTTVDSNNFIKRAN
ncbi:pyocin knob domain-containing protein [Xanthomonas arboricola]|uniref:pyocin knob domain-containing protein n=1 Tax=Xanthomonas arboricola TaxID=56448 RepID=UPI000F8CDFDB|nr:pyocin knob domain-containing protein [Xanthomonas arboricola]